MIKKIKTLTNSKERMTKEFKVKSLINGEHTFEPATFVYSLENTDSSSRLMGTATNNPKEADIPSTRVYILGSSWHVVNHNYKFFNQYQLGIMECIWSFYFCYCNSSILIMERFSFFKRWIISKQLIVKQQAIKSRCWIEEEKMIIINFVLKY